MDILLSMTIKFTANAPQANIVVDSYKRPRITDFGLARAIDLQLSLTKSSLRGTCPLKWLAPELLNPCRFKEGVFDVRTSVASDVYAFGMTIFEVRFSELVHQCTAAYRISQVFSGEAPFHTIPESVVVIEVGVNDRRPARPVKVAIGRGLDDDMWIVMQSCWQVNSAARPTISSVVSFLGAKARRSFGGALVEADES